MNKQIIVYIDGTNLHKATVKNGWIVDYTKFYIWLCDKFSITHAFIFIGYLSMYEKLYSKMRLAGFTIIFKKTTIDRIGEIKGNCDADLVLKCVRDTFEMDIGHTIITSSDGDFSSLVEFLKEKEKTVTLVSPSNNCSILLMHTGVKIIYASQIRSHIEKL